MLSTTVKVGEVRLTRLGPEQVIGRSGHYWHMRNRDGEVRLSLPETAESMPLLCPAPEDIRVGDVFETPMGRVTIDHGHDIRGVSRSCLRGTWRIVERRPEPAIATPASKTDPLDATAREYAGIARYQGESDDALRRRAREAIYDIAFGSNVATAFSPGAFGGQKPQTPQSIRDANIEAANKAIREPHPLVLEFGQRKGAAWDRYVRAIGEEVELANARPDPVPLTASRILACATGALR